MRKYQQLLILSFIIIFSAANLLGAEFMNLKHIGSFHTGIFNQSAAEICAYDPATKKLFVVNAIGSKVLVLDISNPNNPNQIANIDISQWGPVANSVDVKNGIVAVAVENSVKTQNGKVVFFNTNGVYLNNVVVGALPDMLTFSKDGRYVVVCNEGEPNDSYTIDPEGSITIIDLINGVANPLVKTADFKSNIGMETHLRSQGIRIFGPNANAAQDFEPEFAAITDDNKTAYVTLQDNNAYAVVDIQTGKVTSVKTFGYKNYNLKGNEFDASDRDNMINIANWPVFGMYQPDAVASFKYDGKNYFVTANEGDSRDYAGFAEEARVKDLPLDPVAFPNKDYLQKDPQLGRLTVTKTMGDNNKDGKYESIYVFGGRSVSIFDENGNQVFDSGSELERILAEKYPNMFNSDHAANAFDNRSDNKGPEPEGLTLGFINNQVYAFVGMERIGGIAVYNITNPYNAYFVTYSNNRDFSAPYPKTPNLAQLKKIGDLGPEGLIHIPAAVSPNQHDLVVVANEVSGSVSIYQVILAPVANLVNKETCFEQSVNLGNIAQNGANKSVLYGSGDYSYIWTPSSVLKFNADKGNPVYENPRASRNFTMFVTDNQTGLSTFGQMSASVKKQASFSLPSLYKHPKNTQLNLFSLLENIEGKSPFNYIWFDENQPVNNPTAVVPKEGFNKYYLTLQDADGCYSNTKRTLVYVSPLGKESFDDGNIAEGLNGNSLAVVYPNPCVNNLNIIAEFESKNSVSIEIIDLDGKVVKNFNAVSQNINQNIDISSIQSGTYFVRIYSNDDTIIYKIIKN